MSKSRKNPSKAPIIMNSMRSMGYSFEAALADVIDNSISAHAKDVTILFPKTADRCFVAICDDGEGMSSDELFEAMCYGSDVETHIGTAGDLGRFGLGMKTASLSQCKKMTVVSKKNNIYSGFCWDMDHVKEKNDWEVLELNDSEIQEKPGLEYLSDKKTGTIVIWEEFDVIEKSTGDVFASLDKYKEKSSNYLSLIFHRFLNDNDVVIKVNNFELTGYDPFLENHPKTNVKKTIDCPIEDSNGVERIVKVTPYVLPFQKDLSKKDIALVGGYEELRTKQGFYIYREKRLIIYGTWFGLKKNELTKHARIKVDIPNTLDDIWNIDIKKQNAVIPKRISNEIKRVVEESREVAVKRQKYRGELENIDSQYSYIWQRNRFRDKYTYKINRESIIADLFDGIEMDDALSERIEMMLKNIEDSIPYQDIYIHMSGNEIISEYEDKKLEEMIEDLEFLIELRIKRGDDDIDNIIETFYKKEPFCKYPETKEVIRRKFQ